jgi:predicted nucleic acid-binding protein
LLAALDRLRPTTSDTASPDAAPTRARLVRAEAQVWAILGERLRASLSAPERRTATDAILAEVAAHHLDPYAAADRLLAVLQPER